ncbi:uncharacterized protein LOC114282360 [Camellia sinensis]|uniref:uncharacterized protein LOC114282360 n=1 Tax=Camellia sinensis TaxID=4442 RepID=UPI00103571BC|nr:uncharacterized protein LOC114282360 [Camellia sinensis]
MASLAMREWKMMEDANEFALQLGESSENATFFTTIAQPNLVARVVKAQLGDPISPRRGLMRFGQSGKLSPRFIGPFDIIKRIGEVVYHLALSPQLSGVHNMFHVSMLCKYEPNPSHVLDWTEIKIDKNVSYEEKPLQILLTREKVLRGKTIPLVKVLWRHHGVEEATWEREVEIREKYTDLFSKL